LRLHVVRPVLKRISLWSKDAENLVLGTALVESNLRYIKQVGGPALGLWQCEGKTHYDIWMHYLAYRSQLRAELVKLAGYFSAEFPDPGELMTNLSYACAICRVHYRRQKDPIPGDALGMAQLWKNTYNTKRGKGTVEKAFPHFEFAIATYVGLI